jgi:hypothetical protein
MVSVVQAVWDNVPTDENPSHRSRHAQRQHWQVKSTLYGLCPIGGVVRTASAEVSDEEQSTVRSSLEVPASASQCMHDDER